MVLQSPVQSSSITGTGSCGETTTSSGLFPLPSVDSDGIYLHVITSSPLCLFLFFCHITLPLSFTHFLTHIHTQPSPHSWAHCRINLPRHMVHAGGEDEEGGVAMKASLSADRLEVDSDVSSELSFGYEFAQAEVMMKGMGNNGESD